MLPVPTPEYVFVTFVVWFVLTLLSQHPGIAGIITALIMAIFFPIPL